MKAIRVHRPGAPEVLQIDDIAIPEPRRGWVRIRVHAFGLNRSELYTRQGHSPGVVFPRVLGIECAGTVDANGDTDLQVGDTVIALMGGMGRQYDGGYAEYCLAPRDRVMPVGSGLSWDVLAALPETFLTAWGSLVEALGVKAGETLLIRGGTSSVGMAAATLAKDMGVRIIATTRSAAKVAALRANGADEVIIDAGRLQDEVVRLMPNGVDRILELVGVKTLRDSLRCVRRGGTVCNTGILGDAWVMDAFEPLEDIPSSVKLTTFHSDSTSAERSTSAMQAIVDGVAAGRLRPNLHRCWSFDEVVAAHRYMEANYASGKMVIKVDS